MYLKDILDEMKARGEKIKEEVLDEVVKSKTLNKIVSNKNFIRAVSTMIATKDEVQKTLNKQVKNLIKTMEVATQRDLTQLLKQLSKMESELKKSLLGKAPSRRVKKKAATKKKKTSTKKKKKTTKKKSSAKRKPAKKKSASRKASQTNKKKKTKKKK